MTSERTTRPEQFRSPGRQFSAGAGGSIPISECYDKSSLERTRQQTRATSGERLAPGARPARRAAPRTLHLTLPAHSLQRRHVDEQGFRYVAVTLYEGTK
ncbi:hypothetical protein EVAR_6730_1 [Eumeta japonica]|uniref:Uncharacterized protein n=1 Tax=Eumeta variegata TaxID=151549 RepID=A0A4C1V523_EUMVA|nr:hypothetical protein EVAR_6730_1 [Eumeta japonica]